MFLTHRNLPAPVSELSERLDRLFQNFFESPPRWDEPIAPNVDVWEDDQAYHVEVELPGFKMEEIELLVHENELTIEAKHNAEPAESKKDEGPGIAWHRRERSLRTYRRSLSLPLSLDASKATAALADGILTLSLPKAEAAKPRRIPVTVKNGKK